MLGSWDAEDLSAEPLGKVSEGTRKHYKGSRLILRSESKFRGKPLLTQTPAIRARDSAGVSTIPQKVGLQRSPEVCPKNWKVSHQRRVQGQASGLGAEGKSRGVLFFH